jgi:Ca-activated chloride channel family protein
VEALYTFPVPKGASVANFSMWIQGKEMTGEVVEKTRARQIYRSYKTRRRDPGLLEQTDYRTFEMRIFPIPAGAAQKVRILYYQELEFDYDWANYVYPLETVTRKCVNSSVLGKFAFNIEAKSPVPISRMESPSHPNDFVAVEHTDCYWGGSLETAKGNLNEDLVVAYQVTRPVTGIDLITSKTPDEDGYLCMTLMVGEESAQAVRGMDYLFVLDISGSMAQGGKSQVSRSAIMAFLGALLVYDRFDILTFNMKPEPLFNQLRVADSESRAAATAFVNSQNARGGTHLLPAIAATYRYADPPRPFNIVILSDGLTDQKDRTRFQEIMRACPANARIFCVGMGNDVDRSLLEQVAQEGGGLAAFVSPGDNFERQARAFRQKLLRPVAMGLKIDFDGERIYGIEPPRLPNLYYGIPVRLYARYRGDGPIDVTVQANVNGQLLRKSVSVDLPAEDAGNPEIERMWAWHRIDRLLKEAERDGSPESAKAEVVRLGEAYSIATEYTSFIVLENDAEFQRWRIERRNLLRNRRDREKYDALQNQLEAMRLKAISEIGPLAQATRILAPGAPQAPRPSIGRPLATSSNAPPATPQATPRSRRGLDFSLPIPSFGGGGAIDPITGGIALGLAALAAARWRRKNRS